jgi:ankyrin repeat protein
VLLANGADVKAKDSGGRTPADEAARRGHKEIINLLCKRAAKK